VVAYNVSRRTREIAIRIALGAENSDVLRLVMGKGLVLVGIGTAIGLAMGFAVEQVMNSMLFNAGGVDIVAYVIVVPSLFLVTMLAAYVPARKASRIAPTQAEDGRVAKPFGFCPLRSVRADFPHTALPEGNPETAVTPCRDE
jgi:ABC-type antimicrobial peptide transport system permease subunit